MVYSHTFWSLSIALHIAVLQSLMSSLVLSWLDYGNAMMAGIPSYLLQQLQLVMNSAARLVFSSSRYDHITPLLHQMHWLRAPEMIQFKLAVLVFKCLHGTAPSYLADELEYTPLHRRSRSASLFRRTLAIGPSLLLPVLGTVCPATCRVRTFYVCFPKSL